MTKNILITGAGGFVGKNLASYLGQFYNVFPVTHSDLDCLNEQNVFDFFKNNTIDMIIHCATVGGVRGVADKKNVLIDNLRMVDNLLKFKPQDCKLILFGSGAMYNKTRSLMKIKEELLDECEPLDLYGQSKLAIAKKIRNRNDVLCLNLFGCYGPDEKSTRFPTYAIAQNLNKQDILINQDVIFDYLFIDDLSKIVKHFIDNWYQKYNVINVTPTKSVSLKQIAEIVNQIGDYISLISSKQQNLGNEYTGDNQRLLCEIPDFAFTPIEDGIKSLYFYIKNNKSF